VNDRTDNREGRMAGVKDAATGGRTTTSRGVSVKKLTDQLESATRKISTLQNAKAKISENSGRAGSALVHAAEIGASSAVGGFGVGLAGEKHNTTARVVRGLGGASMLMWGLVDVLRGKAGNHQMAVGEGLLAAEMAETGARMGQKMHGRWYGASTPAPTATVNGVAGAPAAPPTVAGATVVMTPQVAGPREVLPSEPDLDGFRQRGRVRSSRAS
jgi:hypothetical protein